MARLRVISVGEGGRPWMREAWEDYARRLPKPLRPEAVILDPAKERDPARARRVESEALSRRAGGAQSVALDRGGEQWSTEYLAERLRVWRDGGRDTALLIGGAEGFDRATLQPAEIWSLGPLTLPHGLVRILVAEQLYRAWSVLEGHPYHRA